MKLNILSGLMFATVFSINAQAATSVDLSKTNSNELKNLFSSHVMKINSIAYSENRRDVDLKNILHTRIQQTYNGFPVWGADAVAHIKQGANFKKTALQTLFAYTDSMDGIMYQNLQQDLASTPTDEQENQAITVAIKNYQNKVENKSIIKNPQSKLIVYVDDNNKAHWSYLVNFHASATHKNEAPAIPTFIINAKTLQIDEYWNDMKTHQMTNEVRSGGFGGNIKMGQLIYDGLQQHLPEFNIQRNAKNGICYLGNAEINVQNCTDSDSFSGCHSSEDFQFSCHETNPSHNNIYWNDTDAVNDGYSPSNDALFNADVTKKMYHEWIGTPILTNKDGTPMLLTMVVHLRSFDNAYWDGKAMYFGDGERLFYPLTSLGVTAHEVSHGFTEQHSNLQYSHQSGGMNEAYSDMAAKAAEFYGYGKTLNWDLGSEIFKEENRALRYIDQPSKDCNGKSPGENCSIDDASQYNNSLDVHYSSGVYNRFYYTLSTSEGWDAKKTFILMANTNAYYWTSKVNFKKGACGVIKAAKELGYDLDAINKAFKVVKIDTSKC